MEPPDLPVRQRLGIIWAWLLVVGGLLSLAGGYVASHYGPEPGAAAQPGTARLQHLVRQATATANREASQLLTTALATRVVPFGQFLSQSTYPAFLFGQGRLQAWSAAGPLPTAADVADPRPERLAQTSLGDFVVVRQAAAEWVVLVYVPLTRYYGISNRYLRAGSEQALLQGFDVQVRPLG
ncbi:MAG: hypothetical protein EOO55_00415, partial [Hymenobacter sp.]